MEPYKIIQFYRGHGRIENFIKECKNDFDLVTVSSRSKIVTANRMSLFMLAYNLFNWIQHLVLPANMRKLQADSIRIKLMKIVTRAVHSARYIIFKLCNSIRIKNFYMTCENIQNLSVQMEKYFNLL